MSLRQRLEAIRGPRSGALADAETGNLTRRIERLRAGCGGDTGARRIQGDEELARRLDAHRVEDGLLVAERSLGFGRLHGACPVRPPLSGLYTGTENWLLLDTETTGLAGGSGTLAFLVGVARFRDGYLYLRQYLMTRFGAEEAMLRRLCADLPANATLVSYNGKSFDLPLLAARLRLHGLDSPFADRPHLDLLHEVRRRHRGRWENCRLATAERELLGFERKDDLPGSQAPKAWLDYVRGGLWERLGRVMRHNRLDLISLAVLPEALEGAVAARQRRPGGERCVAPATPTAAQRLRALRISLSR
jgi:hypothetical protein